MKTGDKDCTGTYVHKGKYWCILKPWTKRISEPAIGTFSAYAEMIGNYIGSFEFADDDGGWFWVPAGHALFETESEAKEAYLIAEGEVLNELLKVWKQRMDALTTYRYKELKT
jgi:hypothetical protein